MKRLPARRIGILLAIVAWLVIGCSPAAGPGDSRTSAGSTLRTEKRVVAAILGDPVGLYTDLYPPDVSTAGTNRGIEALQEMLLTGLSVFDNHGVLRPALAEAVPSVENDLWRLSPDGRMETTWRLREGTRWHDGLALNSSDLAFTLEVGRDTDLTGAVDPAYASIAAVSTPDPRTVTVAWSRPFTDADTLFSRARAIPLARHALEMAYRENKAAFLVQPSLLQEPLGGGPFRVREWNRGSHLLLEAFEGYVLGRPRIDVIEVKFLTDPNTLIANLLADSVELTLGRTLSLEEALQARDQWRSGHLETAPAGSLKTRPQHFTPNPAVVAEPVFRRALLYATSRQALVDSLLGGQSAVAHSVVAPDDALARTVEDSVVRYDYDPRRARELIQSLGYSLGSDGFFRDGGGQKLLVEHRTLSTDINAKTLYIMTDDWRRLGVDVDPVIIPTALAQNRQYRDGYPAFETQRGNPDLYSLSSLMSTSSSRHRYNSLSFDRLIEQYLIAIEPSSRLTLLRQILRQMTDEVVLLDLFWDVEPTMIGDRLRNVTARNVRSSHTWNIQDWDVGPAR